MSQWVEFLCDNVPMVAALSCGTSREGDLNIVLHYLAFLAVHHSFAFTVSSFCDIANPVADALSCFLPVIHAPSPTS